jgi:excisionase family DNA binding protein
MIGLNPVPELLTIKETAAKLNLRTEQTLYRWIRRGWLEAKPFGSRGVRISSTIVDEILKNGLSVWPKSNLNPIGKLRVSSRLFRKEGKAWR